MANSGKGTNFVLYDISVCTAVNNDNYPESQGAPLLKSIPVYAQANCAECALQPASL